MDQSLTARLWNQACTRSRGDMGTLLTIKEFKTSHTDTWTMYSSSQRQAQSRLVCVFYGSLNSFNLAKFPSAMICSWEGACACFAYQARERQLIKKKNWVMRSKCSVNMDFYTVWISSIPTQTQISAIKPEAATGLTCGENFFWESTCVLEAF